MTTPEQKLLRLQSINLGLDYKCPCGCTDLYGWKADSPGLHELELAQRPHIVPAIGKIQKETFKAYMNQVTTHEVEWLKVLNLPSIEAVRRAELNDDDGSGTWEYSGTMDAKLQQVFYDWREALVGTKNAKGVDEISAVYPFYQLEAFAIGVDKTLQEALDSLPGALTGDALRAAKVEVSLQNPYLAAVNREGTKRITTELGRANVKKVLLALRRMAREGTSPIEVARWMRKITGEGKAWYWLRLARSESVLAFDAAFEASIKQYSIPFEEWSAASNACPICTQFVGDVWPAGKGPHPVEDTHPSCRCRRIPKYVLPKDQVVRNPWTRATPYDDPYTPGQLRELQRENGGTIF